MDIFMDSTLLNISSPDGTETSLTSWTNETECTDYDSCNQFIMPWWRKSLWAIVYVALVVVATVGNLVVIWIVVAHEQMRTITNLFLVNLAVSDFLMSTMNVIFNFLYSLNSHWPFGESYCQIVQFVSVLSVSASVLTLMVISLDRYFAIIYPLRRRISTRCTHMTVSVLWIVSGLLSLPIFYVVRTSTTEYDDGTERTVCYFYWSNDPDLNQLIDVNYNVTIFVLTYLLPLLVMAVCYFHVALRLWGSGYIGEATAVQRDSVNNKRRVVKMMITIVVIFAVCWLPYQLYFLIIPSFPELTKTSFTQDIYLAIYWLAMSNSMYNPIIYYWMNVRFRQGFQRVFCCAADEPVVNLTSTRSSRSRTNQRTIHLTLANINGTSIESQPQRKHLFERFRKDTHV